MKCKETGCRKPVRARGVCSTHHATLRRHGLIPKRTPRHIQFWTHVRKTNKCWLWMATRLPRGYGCTQGGLAHRISYQYAHGAIPKGLFVLHTCDNPPCVNPAHLFVGTHRDNMRDARLKGRPLGCKAREGRKNVTNAKKS